MSLIGGILIGLAALFLMAMNGCVMGISGILAGLTIQPPKTVLGGSPLSLALSSGHLLS